MKTFINYIKNLDSLEQFKRFLPAAFTAISLIKIIARNAARYA